MRRLAIVALLTGSLTPACVNLSSTPQVIVGPMRDAPSDAAFERVLAWARALGYETQTIQARRGRFLVRARYADRFGSYLFTIECSHDGYVSITPLGPRVERNRDRLILPAQLRQELYDLAAALERAALERAAEDT